MRCVLGCVRNEGSSLHRFPNFTKFPEQFKAWVFIVGGKLERPEDHLKYKNKRVCDIHFTSKDRNRNNRLSALAVPSLHLPTWCNKFDENLLASQLTVQTTSNQIEKGIYLNEIIKDVSRIIINLIRIEISYIERYLHLSISLSHH
ncbi:uncharacterized protein LOC123656312 [Melitaea cinxia]|uniref:uncharacterized protein LOC123656312 n=1 Tax=Melitaea cinxia TaxID=113334 RepID=UPI001E273ABC|nr:uncharacterized protein LOC123656312 [Melitaea cinxia]